jgi:hypothetical protein
MELIRVRDGRVVGCREHGADEIGLHVVADSPGARNRYEQVGFVETGRLLRKRL